MAMAGAYVLAEELHRAGTARVQVALGRYEQRLRLPLSASRAPADALRNGLCPTADSISPFATP